MNDNNIIKDQRFHQMKTNVHPEYEAITATCNCGNVFKTRSTLCKDIRLDICSTCHPFYTGKQKIIDNSGRVEKFRQRFERQG